jgi:hypothetical protein
MYLYNVPIFRDLPGNDLEHLVAFPYFSKQILLANGLSRFSFYFITASIVDLLPNDLKSRM